MALSLDAPIEDLKLSKRVRNVLRRRGFNTLGSLLQRDYKPALRGFGPASRSELACVLAANGFALPANLSSSECQAAREDAWKYPTGAEPPQQRNAVADQALADQFNHPLTVICAASACLLQATKLNARQRELVVLVEEESVRLTRLVQQLLDMLPPEQATSPTAGKQKDVRKPQNGGAFADEGVLNWCDFHRQVTEQARPIELEETWHAL